MGNRLVGKDGLRTLPGTIADSTNERYGYFLLLQPPAISIFVADGPANINMAFGFLGRLCVPLKRRLQHL
jgi:hypothetical protein